MYGTRDTIERLHPRLHGQGLRFVGLASCVAITLALCGISGLFPLIFGTICASQGDSAADFGQTIQRFTDGVDRALRLIHDNLLSLVVLILLTMLLRGAAAAQIGHMQSRKVNPPILQLSPPRTDRLTHEQCTSLRLSPPKVDLLTYEQCASLLQELLGGQDGEVKGLPRSISHALAIFDSGCAKSMGNHVDQFTPGSLVEGSASVIGVGGAMKISEVGELRWPMETQNHGIRKWIEGDSPYNPKCPYVLLSPGRAQLEHGISVEMPGWGADGRFSFPSGVSVTLVNRLVWVLRPIGYKRLPSASLASISPNILGVPDEGPFILYISSGPIREGSISHCCESIGVEAKVVCIDPVIGGDAMDITKRSTAIVLTAAAADRRCVGVFWSIRCKTWSAATWLKKHDGSPGTPYRDIDSIKGIRKSDGSLPRVVIEANLETEHTAQICHAAASHGAFVVGEQPARRRSGHCVPKHALLG